VRIWLPDDETRITVDVSKDGDCTLYGERVTMVLKPITPPSGFGKEKED
jgi:hypothetical protein